MSILSKGRTALLVALFALAAGGPAVAATAALAPFSNDTLQKMLTDMGYTPEVDNGEVDIHITSPVEHYVYFDISKDGTVLYTDVTFADYSAAEFKKLDLLALLKANDNGRSYFSIEQQKDKTTLVLSINQPVAGLTSATLRTSIDSLLGHEADTHDLWAIWDK